MTDYAFYNAGCEGAKGLGRLVVPARRLLRRLLQPMFLRQVELYQHLERRQDKLLASQLDNVALARRLAMLEDQVAMLAARTSECDDVSAPVSLPFPAECGSEADHSVARRQGDSGRRADKRERIE